VQAAEQEGEVMELEVFGSWAGSPGANSACSGYLVAESSTKVLFDCGPGLVPVAQERHDLGSIAAIFISHMHADHALDLLTYAYRLIRFTWRGTDLREVRRVPLYLPPGGLRVLDHVAAAFGRPGSERLGNPFTTAFIPQEVKPGALIFVENLVVIPQEVHHTLPAVGYRVDSPTGSFAYSGDTMPCPGLEKLASGVELFLCEATAREENRQLAESAAHMTARQAGELAQAAGAQCLVLTHLIRQDHDWLSGIMDEASQEYTGELFVARKGLQISTLGTGAQAAHSLGLRSARKFIER